MLPPPRRRQELLLWTYVDVLWIWQDQTLASVYQTDLDKCSFFVCRQRKWPAAVVQLNINQAPCVCVLSGSIFTLQWLNHMHVICAHFQSRLTDYLCAGLLLSPLFYVPLQTFITFTARLWTPLTQVMWWPSWPCAGLAANSSYQFVFAACLIFKSCHWSCEYETRINNHFIEVQFIIYAAELSY